MTYPHAAHSEAGPRSESKARGCCSRPTPKEPKTDF